MAQRRMFNKTITNSDNFLDMPDSSQNLYFHLSMNADDDGFVDNWKSIMRMSGHKEDDLKILIAKQYIIPFETGVIVIRHWRLNNYLQKDRIVPTAYQKEKEQLVVDNTNVYNLYTDCIHSIDKISIDKNSIVYNNIYVQMFEQFYEQYPKKEKKEDTKKWFLKNKPTNELFNTIINALDKFKRSKQWQNKQYIPLPTSWLNQKRWEDELEQLESEEERLKRLEEEIREEEKNNAIKRS